MDLRVLEILVTRELETKLESSLERTHLHPTQHWERNLLLQESYRSLEKEQKRGCW